jgi:hypothetical protein
MNVTSLTSWKSHDIIPNASFTRHDVPIALSTSPSSPSCVMWIQLLQASLIHFKSTISSPHNRPLSLNGVDLRIKEVHIFIRHHSLQVFPFCGCIIKLIWWQAKHFCSDANIFQKISPLLFLLELFTLCTRLPRVLSNGGGACFLKHTFRDVIILHSSILIVKSDTIYERSNGMWKIEIRHVSAVFK